MLHSTESLATLCMVGIKDHSSLNSQPLGEQPRSMGCKKKNCRGGLSVQTDHWLCTPWPALSSVMLKTAACKWENTKP